MNKRLLLAFGCGAAAAEPPRHPARRTTGARGRPSVVGPGWQRAAGWTSRGGIAAPLLALRRSAPRSGSATSRHCRRLSPSAPRTASDACREPRRLHRSGPGLWPSLAPGRVPCPNRRPYLDRHRPQCPSCCDVQWNWAGQRAFASSVAPRCGRGCGPRRRRHRRRPPHGSVPPSTRQEAPALPSRMPSILLPGSEAEPELGPGPPWSPLAGRRRRHWH